MIMTLPGMDRGVSTEIVLACVGGRKGSVVEALPMHNLVLFDGQSQSSPVIVLASSCVRLNAHDELDSDKHEVVDP